MKFKKDFLGLDGFYWWIGVVENRKDPLKLGRCQVRVFGAHSENLSDIPSADLPWAHPITPINDSMTFSTPKEGDYVFGFFMDGKYAQYPVMMGVMPGIPELSPDDTKGFSDQRTSSDLSSSPKKPSSISIQTDGNGAIVKEGSAEKYPNKNDLKSPTNSKLARNENIDTTIIGTRKNNLASATGAFGTSWKEPTPTYNAVYPYNKAYESESGHIMEFDDTPGSERIQLAHRSGSFSEISATGTKVEKVVKDNYQIVMGNDYLYVYGKVNITVSSDANIKVVGDVNLECTSSIKMSAGKSIRMKSKDISIEGSNTVNMICRSDVNIMGKVINQNIGNPVYTDLPDVSGK